MTKKGNLGILSTSNFLLPKHEIYRKGPSVSEIVFIGLIQLDCMLLCCSAVRINLVALVMPSQIFACNHMVNRNGLQLCHRGIFIISFYWRKKNPTTTMQCFNTHLKVGVHGNRPTLSSALSVFECYQCGEQLSLFKQLAAPPATSTPTSTSKHEPFWCPSTFKKQCVQHGDGGFS